MVRADPKYVGVLPRVGAWREKVPIRIRFDQSHIGEADAQ